MMQGGNQNEILFTFENDDNDNSTPLNANFGSGPNQDIRKMGNPTSLQQSKEHLKIDTGHKILYDNSVNSSFHIQQAANNNDRLESAHVCQTPTKLYHQVQPWNKKVSINLHDDAQSERKQQSPLAHVPAAPSTTTNKQRAGINQPLGSSYIRTKQMNFHKVPDTNLGSKKVHNLQKLQKEMLLKQKQLE